MLVTDEKRGYDTTGHFYYLTHIGAEQETGLVLMWSNVTQRLKDQARDLDLWLSTNVHNQTKQKRYRPVDFLEYRIFKNELDEAEMIYRLLVEMVKWAYHSDGDLMKYEDNATVNDLVPMVVKQLAYSYGLKFDGNVDGYIEESEWRVGY